MFFTGFNELDEMNGGTNVLVLKSRNFEHLWRICAIFNLNVLGSTATQNLAADNSLFSTRQTMKDSSIFS